MAIHAVKVEDFHSKLTSCSTCRLAGRMAIHTVKVEDFHSKLPSCSTCRLAGRMAIHAVKVEDFHSNIKAHAGSFLGVCFLTIYKNFFLI